ncbi:hypothetical protein LTR37_006513 [Vermiconidia calcicola]|uniref:Uncharacterized protein n=1 Tax=Vermiconidia calcicola TaxID=1690605 RepID=A0ACC3NJ14_9PEZI|nr:hypothetical protein LTR37_006513 [Vermiconidia calcicola]
MVSQSCAIANDKQVRRDKDEAVARYLAAGGRNIWHGFTCDDYDAQSAATPPTCQGSCMTCSDQYVPLSSRNFSDRFPLRMHDDDEAKAVVNDLISTAKANNEYIRTKLDEYGNMIAKRWLKRPNSTKRKILLKTAKPNISTKTHAEVELMYEYIRYKEAQQKGTVAKKPAAIEGQEDLFIIPYLNLQTLGEDPMKLLALLHYRTEVEQCEWVMFDCEQVRTHFHSSVLNIAYNPHCVIAYGKDFGKLVQWNKDAAHRWDVIGYPCARLILRTQQKISDFLRTMVDLLLGKDLEAASKGRHEWDCLVASAFKQQSSLITESPYCRQAFAAAPKFSAELIVETFTSQLHAAQDDGIQVQTDPVYVRQLFDDIDASRAYGIIDRKLHRKMLLRAPLTRIVRADTWDWLLSEAESLLRTQRTYSDKTQVGMPLPEEYLAAITRFEVLLKNQFNRQVEELTDLLCTSQGFERHFQSVGNTYMQTTGSEKNLKSDFLFWNLSEITGYESELGQRTSFHMECIDEHLSQASYKERGKVSQELYDHLADMATVDGALCALKYHRSRQKLYKIPRSKTFDPDSIRAYFSEATKVSILQCDEERQSLWEAVETFRNLPLPTRAVNRQTLLRLKNLHGGLSTFWEELRTAVDDKIDDWCREIGRDGRDYAEQVIKMVVTSVFNVSGTPEYRWALEQEQEAILSAIEENEHKLQAQTASKACKADFGEHFSFPTEPEVPTRLMPKITKTKNKSRPDDASEATSPEHGIELHDKQGQLTSVPEVITVGAESVRLFEQVFASFTDAKGGAKWVDFVAAMVDAGCSATHTGGSAVTFKNGWEMKGSIVIHRPHPDATFDTIKLRAIGKRLTKWFGWNEETFVEREKK